MRWVCWFMVMLVLGGADAVRADEAPRRTRRVESGPARPGPAEASPSPALAPQPTGTAPVAAATSTRPTLLEPTFLREGVGRGTLVSFEVQAEEAVAWELVVREIDGPVAQIFAGQGAPPARIPWDGRLLDGSLAWCELGYTYELAYADSNGTVGTVAGADFTLPAYSREDPRGLSFLLPGQRLAPGGRGDPVAAAKAGLQSIATNLDRIGGNSAVRIEVLARDETVALALGQAVRAALAALLANPGRVLDLYVGTAEAAPESGTLLVTTAPAGATTAN